MGGYNKDDVNKYIENLIEDFEAKFAEKDTTIKTMNDELLDLRKINSEQKASEAELQKERDSITKALMKANEVSDQIVREAKEAAFKEVSELEVKAEAEREKIIDLKKELAAVQASAAKVLEKFNEALEKTVGTTDEGK
jgi:cell division septum initiation protein DivIVA